MAKSCKKCSGKFNTHYDGFREVKICEKCGYRKKFKEPFKITKKRQRLINIIIPLIFLFIIVLVIFVWLISDNYSGFLNLNDKNEVGDALGGLTAPFVGTAGAILTFIAFYVQYEFNKKQNKIVKAQHIISIKQSFDPYLIMLINYKSDFINDPRNIEIINKSIHNINQENIKNGRPYLSTYTAVDSIPINGWKSGQLQLITGHLKVNYIDEVFERHLKNYSDELMKLFKDYHIGNNKFKPDSIKLKKEDINVLKSLLNNNYRFKLYLDFLVKYNDHILRIFTSIDNQIFHNNNKLNLTIKRYYIFQYISTLSKYESIYNILLLSFHYENKMKIYFYDDKSTSLDLKQNYYNLNLVLKCVFDYYNNTFKE